jgi:hypothetical protein
LQYFVTVENRFFSVVETLFPVLETYGIRTSQFLAGKLAGRLLSPAATQHTPAAIRSTIPARFPIIPGNASYRGVGHDPSG